MKWCKKCVLPDTRPNLKLNENGICNACLSGSSEYKDNISINDTPLKSAEGADAIIVLTEWEEFSSLDWQKMFNVMRKPAWVFDARAFLDAENLKNIGFKVWSLGSV